MSFWSKKVIKVRLSKEYNVLKAELKYKDQKYIQYTNNETLEESLHAYLEAQGLDKKDYIIKYITS